MRVAGKFRDQEIASKGYGEEKMSNIDSNTDTRVRDAFTFSLHGATTIASFAAMPAVANDTINNMLDKRFRQLDDEQGHCQATLRRCA